MGTMIEMGIDGDVKKMWDRRLPDEVADAKASFDRLRKKGYLAYTVDDSGNKGKLISEFDPDAEKIILSPPMYGG